MAFEEAVCRNYRARCNLITWREDRRVVEDLRTVRGKSFSSVHADNNTVTVLE